MKTFTKKFYLYFIAGMTFYAFSAPAQEVTVVLNNTKCIQGALVADSTDFVLLKNDMGEIKIMRTDISRVLHEPDAVDNEFKDIETLNDLVMIHTSDGEVITGVIIAKGASAVIINTDMGRITIPKTKIKLVEYVSKEYAERGEAVRIRLQTGQDVDGYLYSEDRNSLTLTTKQGKLTVEKENVQSIAYNVPVSFSRPKNSADKYKYMATKLENPYQAVPLRKRQDSFELGYSSQFGESFVKGAGLTYRDRFLLKEFQTFAINMEAEFGFNAFGLNKAVLLDENIPGSVTAKGGAFITTLGFGVPMHFFPVEGASYEFFVTPMIETHVVYKSLEKAYPSFPTLDSSERDTKIRFGLGSRIGMEMEIAKAWRLGLSFNMHYLFGESDFNTIAIHVGTKLF
jgi:hypothetical protein